MKKILFSFLSFSALMLHAEQWQILGTRAMGMGGAYVAMAKGPIAQYWNPAGLAQVSTQTFNGIEIPAGVGIEATGGILDNVSEVTEVSNQLDAIKQTQTTGEKVDANQMSAFIKTLGILSKINEKEDSGALVEVAGGINLKFSKFAISVNNYSSVGLNPFIDANNINVVSSGVGGAGGNLPTNKTGVSGEYQTARDNIQTTISNIGLDNIKELFCGNDTSCINYFNLYYSSNPQLLANAFVNEAISSGISATELNEISEEALKYSSDAKEVIDNMVAGGSFDDNSSNVNIRAASFTEFAIGYAKPMDKLLNGLSAGANIKLVRGQIGNKTFEFLKEDETGDAFENLDENLKTSTKPSIDVGFLWNVNDKYPKIPFKPRVGLTIRNILSPSFDGPDGKYKLDRQARFGIALSPFNWWHWAIDIDLTKNSTVVDGFYSRQLSIGTEINILNKKSFNLPIRLGMMKNIAESDSSTMYTAGIGLTFAYIHFEAAVGISSDETTIDGDKYPQKGQAVASIGILF
ncbi:MAG: conjugal transfer protein TraF [Elusimicrobiota bacterium]